MEINKNPKNKPFVFVLKSSLCLKPIIVKPTTTNPIKINFNILYPAEESPPPLTNLIVALLRISVSFRDRTHREFKTQLQQ